MDWFDLALLMLASFRLTHLVVFDTITEPLRRQFSQQPFTAELISCYWCTGVWVSAVLCAGYLLQPGWVRPLLLVLAVAAGQSLLEKLVQRP
ncbi:MAG TPA: DUF1360 domain-containing protein [Symbiobacteriaceae bacterium]|nr:DUF1360 domain-containing protein [Symbiobacteriaceae bacterium]